MGVPKSSSFVFVGFFVHLTRTLAASLLLQLECLTVLGDREKWAESFFGRSAVSRSRMFRGEVHSILKMDIRNIESVQTDSHLSVTVTVINVWTSNKDKRTAPSLKIMDSFNASTLYIMTFLCNFFLSVTAKLNRCKKKLR